MSVRIRTTFPKREANGSVAPKPAEPTVYQTVRCPMIHAVNQDGQFVIYQDGQWFDAFALLFEFQQEPVKVNGFILPGKLFKLPGQRKRIIQ